MKIMRVFTLALIICLLCTALCPAALADSVPGITAGNAIVIELNSGNVLYEKAADDRAAPASTTKIMTLLLTCEALERGDVSLDDEVYANSEDIYIIDDDASNVGIAPGEILSLRELCYCAMLASANEATNVIAAHVAGSVDAFVERMNERAAELGCENTRFVNTDGLPNEEHFTTARELAMITEEALKYDFFLELCGTAEHTVPATNCSEPRELPNSNALINNKSYYGKDYFLEGAYGVKTGHTEAAGYCLVSAVKEGDLDLLTVVLGSTGDGKTGEYFNNFSDTIKLVEYFGENYHGTQILSADEVIYKVATEKGKRSELSLSPAHSVSLLLPSDCDPSELEHVITLDYEPVPAPVKKGAVIGQVDVINAENEVICSCELVAAEDIEASMIDYVCANIGGFFSENITAIAISLAVLIIAAFSAVYIPYKRKGRKS